MMPASSTTGSSEGRYGENRRRRLDFLSKWDKFAKAAISTGEISFRAETLPIFGDYPDPGSLMKHFIAATEAHSSQIDLQTNYPDANHGGSWTLLCDAAVITKDTRDTIKDLITTISQTPIPENTKTYCLQTLASLLAIQTKEYIEIEETSQFLHQHLDCKHEELCAAITILVALGSSFRTVPDLGPRRLEEAMQIIAIKTRSIHRKDIVFAQARLFYLAYRKSFREYEYFYRRIQQQPGALPRLCVDMVDTLTKKYRERNQLFAAVQLNDPWYELLRPGITLACSREGMIMQNNVKVTAVQEFTTRIITADAPDADALTARYLWILREALCNIDYGCLTFITSVFRGKEWLEGFLENMTNLDEFEKTTLLLFNACSPEWEDETAIIRRYQEAWPNIIHVRLDRDPGLYNVWNLGISLAKSEYLSNANIDDRKSRDFITTHLQAFQSSSRHIWLVSAPCYICSEMNLTFELYKSREDQTSLSYYHSPEYYGYPDMFLDYWDPNQASTVMWRNIPHCMPVWRKDLHSEHGLFDERLGGAAADLEFWLRCAKSGKSFRNLNVPKGLYYYSSETTYSARKGQSLEYLNILHINRQSTANQGALTEGRL